MPWNKHLYCSFASSKGPKVSLPSYNCKAVWAIKLTGACPFSEEVSWVEENQRDILRGRKGWAHVSQFFRPSPTASLILTERLDRPCNLTFTIICGIAPGLAILFRTIGRHCSLRQWWLTSSPDSTSQKEKLSSLKNGSSSPGDSFQSQCLHCYLLLTNNGLQNILL